VKRWQAYTLALTWIILFLVAVDNYAWARTDLDFMINQFRYSEEHRLREDWIFTPTFSMPWWDAYIMTMLRLVYSSIIMGFLTAVALYFIVKKTKKSSDTTEQRAFANP